MGDFSRQVGFGNIPGPSERKFDKGYWQAIAQSSAADEDDRELAVLGCFFDDFLKFIRTSIGIETLDIAPTAIVRWLIAHANAGLVDVHAKSETARELAAGERDLYINRLVQEKQEVQGNHFSPDELLTGVGDGLRLPLRALLGKNAAADSKSLAQMTSEDISTVFSELNAAIVDQVAVEIWLDCKGNGYRASSTPDGLIIAAKDSHMERARAVSAHRRSSSHLSDSMMFLDYWWFQVPPASKRRAIGIQLVTKIHGAERIEKLELGYSVAAARNAASSLGSKLRLQHSYFGSFMDEPLPKTDGLALAQIVDAWRFLQSLAQHVFVQESKHWDADDLPRRLRLAPAIGRRLLVSSTARAISVDVDLAGKLIEFLTFRAGREQELWTQPLVDLGNDDVTLVLPCIHSILLERVIERWMRQGGIDLERRGAEFQEYCVRELQSSLKDSPLRDHIQLSTNEVEFKNGSVDEKVDIVIILGSTVLLLEAKCVLWPDDSLQYASLRRTILDGAAQVDRQCNGAKAHYDLFSAALVKVGLKPPAEPNLIRAVLTNSAIYSGFEFDGVPITDLPILQLFLDNELVRLELRQGGQARKSHATKFYDSPEDAASKLEAYLRAPPQLDLAKESIVTRLTRFPIESDEFGAIFHEVLSVEVDDQAVLARFGHTGH